jgi:hypothetical protein
MIALRTMATIAVLTLGTLSVSANEEATMHVELDIFSGRPNPAWNLTAAQATELFQLIASLPLDERDHPAAPGLGYRGFDITEQATPPRQISVFMGRVETIGDQGVEVRYDAARALERWLLGSAVPPLPEAVSQIMSLN